MSADFYLQRIFGQKRAEFCKENILPSVSLNGKYLRKTVIRDQKTHINFQGMEMQPSIYITSTAPHGDSRKCFEPAAIIIAVSVLNN